MTIHAEPYLDVDFAMTEGESELVVSIRTTDGAKLTQQDALDGFMAALEECYGSVVAVVTKEEAENDPELH